MKKAVLILLSVLCVCALFSCSTAGNLPDNSESKPVSDTNPPNDETVIKTDIKAYMNYFVNYFHGPYKAGDDLSNINVLYLSTLFAFHQRENFNFVKVDEKMQVIEISESDLKMIANNLVGSNVDLSNYHHSMENTADKCVDGMYIMGYACDYWNGDLYYIDETSEPKIKDAGDTMTVTAKVLYCPDLGSVAGEQTLVYTFDKVTKDGFMFYRINNIKTAE